MEVRGYHYALAGSSHGKRVVGTRLIIGWVCPRDSPKVFEKRSLGLAAIQTSDHPARSLIAILITASLQNDIIIMNC